MSKTKKAEALQAAEDVAVLHRLYCTLFRSVRQCCPLDQSGHECNPIDCDFLHIRQRYLCLYSGTLHSCLTDECHHVIHQEENVRCGITGRVVDTYNLDSQPPRQFGDDDMDDDDEKPPQGETFRTSRLPQNESGERRPSVRMEQINLQIKRKLQDERTPNTTTTTTTTEENKTSTSIEEVEKAHLKEARRSWMKEAARQRVGVVWNELCDQFVVSADVTSKKTEWRLAMMALWDLYEWAREFFNDAFSSVAPHDFVVAVACNILHTKPFSLLGDRIRLGAISHHIRLPSPLSGNKFEMRLRQPQIVLPLLNDPRSRRDEMTNDAAVAKRLRQLRLQEDDIRLDVQKSWSSKKTATTTMNQSFHKTIASIRRALDRACDACPREVLESLVVHLRVS
jgi:hypothetical protein